MNHEVGSLGVLLGDKKAKGIMWKRRHMLAFYADLAPSGCTLNADFEGFFVTYRI